MKTLDLHGTKHAEAYQKIVSFIEVSCGKYNSTNQSFQIVPMTIITGFSTPMKDIVKRVLVEYGIEFIDESYNGYIVIQ